MSIEDCKIDLDDVLTYDGCFGFDEDDDSDMIPLCNHTEGITEYNIGYTQGYTDDGIPFEAELFFNDEHEVIIGFVMPIVKELECEDFVGERFSKPDQNEKDWNKSILTFGMQELGVYNGYGTSTAYHEYLMENEIIEYCSCYQNSYLKYFVDKNGLKVAQLLTTLKDANERYAMTDCLFVDFK